MTQPFPVSPRADHLVAMYRRGWFPMADPQTGRVEWVQPQRRAVIPLDDRFRVPRSLRARVRSGRFTVTTDTAFAEVIRACADRGDTWLAPEIIDAFDLLHAAGHAHSIEARLEGRLVGGLYGLCLGRVFAGESMFSRPDLGGTDASKACLVALVERLRAAGFVLLDAQLANPHLEQFGMYEMPREEYLAILADHGNAAVPWGP